MQYKFQYPDGLTQYRAVTDMDWSHHSSEILVVSYTAVPKPILEELDTRVGGGGWVAISVPVVRLIFPWRRVIVDGHAWRAVLVRPTDLAGVAVRVPLQGLHSADGLVLVWSLKNHVVRVAGA